MISRSLIFLALLNAVCAFNYLQRFARLRSSTDSSSLAASCIRSSSSSNSCNKRVKTSLAAGSASLPGGEATVSSVATTTDTTINQLGWCNALSTNPNLDEAVAEAVSSAAASASAAAQSPTLAIFYVSSIYEASAFQYDVIFKTIRELLPSVQLVLGSTTGCPIGSTGKSAAPVEVEARASISILLADLPKDGISASLRHVTDEELKDYSSSNTATLFGGNCGERKRPAFMFGTESSKKNLIQFLSAAEQREGIQGFGGIASTVTSLHYPKVFMSTASAGSGWEKHTSGLLALVLDGDIEVKTVVARSCLPVGPMYYITKRHGAEVLEMQRYSLAGLQVGQSEVALSPLEQLDSLLHELPAVQAFSLKKELLVGAVTGTPAEIGGNSIINSAEFYGQKPLSFDPLTGSITVGGMKLLAPEQATTFQFCVRDSSTARKDLQAACQVLQSSLQQLAQRTGSSAPLAVMMIGSVERGNRVFRHQHWESSQVYNVLRSVQQQSPVVGMYSAGSFTTQRLRADAQKIASADAPSLMEADAVYAIITKSSACSEQPATATATAASGDALHSAGTDRITNTATTAVVVTAADVMTAADRAAYSDETDSVIVRKRDPDSAQPVRVGTMDYFIPEKMPQPSNFLESLVWEREKDVDRMREQFQLTRALSQAKLAGLKYPQRDLFQYISDAQLHNELLSAGGVPTPLLMIEILRQSVNNGDSPQVDLDSQAWPAYLSQVGSELQSLNPVIAVGAHADTSTFKGQYEDVTALKTATGVPVFCNDFVVYVFQLLRAKICGADVVKLMAAVLPVQDINYLLKIGKAVGITCVVVVNSKVQLLNVLANVPGVEAISVTSRNYRLWKIDSGKADRILSDAEVSDAIKSKNAAMAAASLAAAANAGGNEAKPAAPISATRLLVFQEGFASADDLAAASLRGVDAVFLGEELLPLDGSSSLKEKVQQWIV